MKSTSFIINTSRGGIVNEDDLFTALENKTIAGAALDVFIDEPLTQSTLFKFPNFFCTPHIGGNSDESILAMGRSAIDHLKKFFNYKLMKKR